ncbi:MAG TPA: IS1595 family transposase [Steroidobacteraceae bacterium]|nr:IS1595 family transposase [Steroidobacteraceae bacterium]
MFDQPQFHDENEARKHLEAIRWPDGPVCPHCGATGDHYRLEGTGGAKGKKARPGLLKCKDCREQFSVTVGTVFESSKIPLTKWLIATHLLCSSKKGISSHQIARTLGVTYKTAWFMTHRIREAMAPGPEMGPLGGPGKTVEADETYLAKSPKTRKPKDLPLHARPAVGVMSLIERGGNIRSLTLTEKSVREHLVVHLDERSRLVTDGSQMYKFQVINHESVDHSKFEWTRGDVHTNTLEGFFSIFKRGLVGTYQHMSKKHLHRYLAEFDFRMNTRARFGVNDAERTEIALAGIEGKRLTYRGPDAT